MTTTKRIGQHRSPSQRVRTMPVPQMEDTDCGAACLVIVLAFCGRRAELHERREQCTIGRDGVSAAALNRAASLRHLELTARRGMVWSEPDGTLRPDQVRALPVHVFFDGWHLAVLEGMRGDMLLPNVLTVGRVLMPTAELARRFGQIALLLAPAVGFQRSGFRFTFALSRGRRVPPYLGVLGAAIGVGLTGAAPAVVASLALRSFRVRVLGVGDAALRAPTVVILSGAAVFVMVVSWTQQRLGSRVLANMAVCWGTRYLWRMACLPREFFYRRNIGGFVTRLHTNDGLAVALSERLFSVVFTLTTAVAYLANRLWLNPVLGITALFIGGLNAVVLRAAAVATAKPLGSCALGSGDSVFSAEAFGLDWANESAVGEFMLGSRPNDLAPWVNRATSRPTWNGINSPKWCHEAAHTTVHNPLQTARHGVSAPTQRRFYSVSGRMLQHERPHRDNTQIPANPRRSRTKRSQPSLS